MTIEGLKNIAQEAMEKAITEKLDSAIIFKYVSNLEKELEKKNKIIDLMASAIDSYDTQLVINTFKNKEDVKEYFERMIENE